jgi:hypothetical protein
MTTPQDHLANEDAAIAALARLIVEQAIDEASGNSAEVSH